MTPATIALLVVAASVAAWAAFLAYLFLVKGRTLPGQGALPDREPVMAGARTAEGAPAYVVELEVPEPKPRPRRPADDAAGVSRRQFLNRSWVTGILVSLGQFGAASIDFLWPRLTGGFGTKINAGKLDDLKAEADTTRTPKFIPDGRFYIAFYQGDPKEAEKIPTYKAANVHNTGVMALYRKCVHLGCSVPWCLTSQWFECPCHGSKYSVNGEYRDGPAPRSLDQFRVEVVNGEVIVDTSQIITGAPRGTVTGQPQPEGEHCVVIGV